MAGKQIKNIVIVGGGTAGWMAAAALSRFFQGKNARITLIESSEFGTVGVGEATIPGFVDFNSNLGIDEQELIKATQATFKLGIQFENWSKLGQQFFHPFADYGIALSGVDFHHYIRRLELMGESHDLEQFCFALQLARQNNFAQPHGQPATPLADYSYAYHFDAGLYAGLLKDFACSQGVTWIDGKVGHVTIRQNDGFIESVQLSSGELISGELFIDCSGFKGLLIEQALQTGYDNWGHWLLCNRAVALQTTSVGEPLPYTRSIAHDAGWQWQIPLQHRTGNGYIYASQFQSDDEAVTLLQQNVQGRAINDVKHFSFIPGRRKKIWNKNCLALGLAAGFLEPLESTSIALIQTAIEKLLQFFPDLTFNQFNIDEVNRRHNAEVEHIRDFLILHYKLSGRDDSDFWRTCKALNVPETLQHKMGLFKSCGHIIQHEAEAFEPSSWLTMYNAFGVKAAGYDARADFISQTQLRTTLQQMRTSIEQAAKQALSHQAFIDRHCKAAERVFT